MIFTSEYNRFRVALEATSIGDFGHNCDGNLIKSMMDLNDWMFTFSLVILFERGAPWMNSSSIGDFDLAWSQDNGPLSDDLSSLMLELP